MKKSLAFMAGLTLIAAASPARAQYYEYNTNRPSVVTNMDVIDNGPPSANDSAEDRYDSSTHDGVPPPASVTEVPLSTLSSPPASLPPVQLHPPVMQEPVIPQPVAPAPAPAVALQPPAVQLPVVHPSVMHPPVRQPMIQPPVVQAPIVSAPVVRPPVMRPPVISQPPVMPPAPASIVHPPAPPQPAARLVKPAPETEDTSGDVPNNIQGIEQKMEDVTAQIANTPVQPAPPAADVPVPTPADLTLEFTGNAPEIDTASETKLNDVISQMTAFGDLRLQVRAYATGEDGTQSSARRISLSRALSVRSYLMDKGIKPNRVDVRAMGSDTDHTPADRVDLIFIR